MNTDNLPRYTVNDEGELIELQPFISEPTAINPAWVSVPDGARVGAGYSDDEGGFYLRLEGGSIVHEPMTPEETAKLRHRLFGN